MLSKVNEALTLGGYWTTIETTISEDGDITIGANLAATTLPDNWTILDNFRLYYGKHDTVTVASSANYTMPDDTKAPVVIHSSATYKAGTLYPFAAPCDIPGSCFKNVYEVASLDYANKTAYVYPVDHLRGGVASIVEFNDDTNDMWV